MGGLIGLVGGPVGIGVGATVGGLLGTGVGKFIENREKKFLDSVEFK